MLCLFEEFIDVECMYVYCGDVDVVCIVYDVFECEFVNDVMFVVNVCDFDVVKCCVDCVM